MPGSSGELTSAERQLGAAGQGLGFVERVAAEWSSAGLSGRTQRLSGPLAYASGRFCRARVEWIGCGDQCTTMRTDAGACVGPTTLTETTCGWE